MPQRALSPIPRPYSSQSSHPKSPTQATDWDSAGDWESSNKSTEIPSSQTPVAGTANLSKEEKALEMARRKEERKQVSHPRRIDLGNSNTDKTTAYCYAERTKESRGQSIALFLLIRAIMTFGLGPLQHSDLVLIYLTVSPVFLLSCQGSTDAWPKHVI